MVIKVEKLSEKQIVNLFLPQKITADNGLVIALPDRRQDNDLCHAIMQIKGIERCLLAENLLAVKYENEQEYEEIKLQLLAEIDDYISAGGEIITNTAELPVIATAEILADSLIRPTLNRDGGDLQFVRFSDGVLSVQFTGHCAGCPYAQNTLNNVVSKALCRYIPEIQKIQVEE